MKKKLLLTSATILLCISQAVTTLASSISLDINGEPISTDVSPQIIDGRTMVPVRSIFEAVGATVVWDAETKTIVGTKGNTTVIMTINSTTETINGEEYGMDTSPLIVDGRTLAPAKYVAEAFGYTVNWDADTKTVSIIGSDSNTEIEYLENNFDIDPYTFADIKVVFENYANRLLQCETRQEAMDLASEITDWGDGSTYTSDYQQFMNESETTSESVFAQYASLITGQLAIYRGIDLYVENELGGYTEMDGLYDSAYNYGSYIFKADDMSDVLEVLDTLIEGAGDAFASFGWDTSITNNSLGIDDDLYNSAKAIFEDYLTEISNCTYYEDADAIAGEFYNYGNFSLANYRTCYSNTENDTERKFIYYVAISTSYVALAKSMDLFYDKNVYYKDVVSIADEIFTASSMEEAAVVPDELSEYMDAALSLLDIQMKQKIRGIS